MTKYSESYRWDLRGPNMFRPADVHSDLHTLPTYSQLILAHRLVSLVLKCQFNKLCNIILWAFLIFTSTFLLFISHPAYLLCPRCSSLSFSRGLTCNAAGWPDWQDGRSRQLPNIMVSRYRDAPIRSSRDRPSAPHFAFCQWKSCRQL